MTLPAEQTDAELIAQTRAGDMGAYDELYRRHLPDTRRVARIVTDNHAEAEDVVAEAFTRVLARLVEGDGPDLAVTPYLRTVVRRLAIDRHRAARQEGHPADPAMLAVLPSADDDIARATDRQLVREAFETLPERWQRVLWQTEIEGRPPAALTPGLGSSPNAVSALAYRAREGLRQAYLAVHLSSTVPERCKPFVPMLASYIRESLSDEDDVAVAIHLDTCAACRERRDELLLLVSDVRAVLAPALVGSLVALSDTAGLAPPGPGAVEAEATAQARHVARRRSRRVLGVAATTVVSAAAAAAVAFAAVSAMNPGPPAGERIVGAPAITSEYTPTTSGTSPAARVGTAAPSKSPTVTETAEPTVAPVEAAPSTQEPTQPAAGQPAAAASADTERSQAASAAQSESPRRTPRQTQENPAPPASTSDDPEAEPDESSEPEPTESESERGRDAPTKWLCDLLDELGTPRFAPLCD